MKLISCRLQNFRSIIDTGTFWFQKDDGISILAGQNESGKSSILKLLRSFSTGEIDKDDLIDENVFPVIELSFDLSKFELENKENINEIRIISDKIKLLKQVTVSKTFSSYDNYTFDYDVNTNKELSALSEKTLETASEEYVAYLISESKLKPKIEASNVEKIVSGEKQIQENKTEIPDEEYKILVEKAIENYIEYAIYDKIPSIILFNDYADILPKSVLISDLKEKNDDAKGYNAVKNMELVLNTDFTSWSDLSDRKRGEKENKLVQEITADFKEYWRQRIEYGDGAKIIVQYNQGTESGPYLNFFIETQANKWLSPNQRSDGFKWFLSFYLELKARNSNSTNFLILFDEPGLYLHSKAQVDMLKVLEEISNKHQIIYTTHSPYLIQEEKINRVRLVFNNDNEGTTVEKLTTSKSKNKREAIKPVVDAMGLKMATEFSAVKQKNVIVEGISDYYYFTAMKKILNRGTNIDSFVPSMGASNAHLLMELCIGWGLDWIIVFDDKGAKKDYNKIKKNFFNNSEAETNQKIYTLNGCDGIEDMFELSDLCLINSSINIKDFSDMNDFITKTGGKELIGRLFLERVSSGVIDLKKISSKAKNNFKNAFDFIEEKFK